MHDFIAQYYFEIKSKEIGTLLPYIELAFSKFLEKGTCSKVWKHEDYIPSLRLTWKISTGSCAGN